MRVETLEHRTSTAVPVALIVGAALSLSLSATFVKLAGTDARTAAFLRCAVAVLALAPLALVEVRRRGGLRRGLCVAAAAAGVFLGIDYTMWTASILDVGAGISTVLINVQVIVFPVLCLVIDRTPIPRRFVLCAPLMLAGLALAGGVLGHDAGARHALRGALLSLAAGVAYSGYLYLNRRGGAASPRHVVAPVAIATTAAAVTTGVTGVAGGGITLALPAASWGWLIALALLGQVLSWLLLGAATPALAPNTAAALLLLQPVLAVGAGMLIVAEAPTAVQLAGCAVVVLAVGLATAGGLSRRAGYGRSAGSRTDPG